jgi:cytochrome c oxidase cbb3-type subunit III
MKSAVADLPSEFWGGWIVAITVTTFFALLWLVIDVYRGGTEGDEQHVWDETLREGTKPAPIWWFWFILGLMSVSVIYVMLYPGLGTYRGALGWSQGGQIAERVAEYDARFGPERRRILKRPLAALAADENAMRSAWHVFNNNCSACHGRDAAGQARQFPDLTDEAWQWGAEEQQIAESIRSGRQGVMPGWLEAVGERGVVDLTDHVLALSGGTASATATAAGGALYEQFCIACHGPDGSGNPLLGAPALNDSIWTYGGDRAAVSDSIANGRNGTMPAFGARLDDTQIRLLSAWLKSGLRTPHERGLSMVERP